MDRRPNPGLNPERDVIPNLPALKGEGSCGGEEEVSVLFPDLENKVLSRDMFLFNA